MVLTFKHFVFLKVKASLIQTSVNSLNTGNIVAFL